MLRWGVLVLDVYLKFGMENFIFEQYKKEGKNHFTVAIGCTGGQHRSVTITNFLYDHYRHVYNCYKEHRDEKEWIKNEA